MPTKVAVITIGCPETNTALFGTKEKLLMSGTLFERPIEINMPYTCFKYHQCDVDILTSCIPVGRTGKVVILPFSKVSFIHWRISMETHNILMHD